MKKLLYIFCIVLHFAASAQAQIKLIGVSNNTETGTIDLIQWEVFNSSSLTATPTALDAYLFASSAFDSFNSNYYISGMSGQAAGLYFYNMDTGESSLTSGAISTSIAEFDMSTSKMYNLIMEIEEYVSVYEYDIENNQESLIGTIYQPGAIGLVADAIGFDSNNGILYYVGYTSASGLALYSIPVREESFSFSETPLITPSPFSSITSLNFDNVNEKLFAAYDTFDDMGDYAGRSIVEIDVNTGAVSTLGQLSEFAYFVGGSSQFDQNSGTFLLVGINSNNTGEMIAFDTYTNTYVSGFVPSVSEIVCDNTIFAQNRYMPAGIAIQDELNFSLYPNPVTNTLNVECTSHAPVKVRVFTSMGELVYEATIAAVHRVNIDMSTFSSGLYTVHLTDAKQNVSKKIVVQ